MLSVDELFKGHHFDRQWAKSRVDVMTARQVADLIITIADDGTRFFCEVVFHQSDERGCATDDGSKVFRPQQVVANAVPSRQFRLSREASFRVKEIDCRDIRRLRNVERLAR